VLGQIADGLDARAADTAELWSAEVGAVHSFTTLAAQAFGAAVRGYAAMADTFPFEEVHAPTAGGAEALLLREPVGVVGAIIAWNGPMFLLVNKVAPALLAGCTVVLKAAPDAPGAAWLFAEIADAAGLPPGVLNVVCADREASEELVRDPRVDKITFTGSTAAGQRIGALCGQRMARATLELGGKSAAVVLDDYPVDLLADHMVDQISLVSGQVCNALSRVIISGSRHDEAVEAIAARMRAKVVGDAFDPATALGPLVSAAQRDRVEGYIRSGIDGGAVLAAGGRRPSGLDRGFYVEPTVFGRVDRSDRIAREEIFGPVLCVTAAADEADAVAIANDSDFGLNASIFTHDTPRALDIARRIRSGTVGQNACRGDFGIAFGVVKQSGVGREGGLEGLRAFTETKTVILEDTVSDAGR
jgi:aldehyde dehydrogenase (NAD+)